MIAKRRIGRASRLPRVLRRLRPLVAPHRARVAVAASAATGAVVTGLLAPWPLQIVIDGVLLDRRGKGIEAWLRPWLPDDRDTLLLAACVALVAIAVLRGLFAYWQNLAAATVGQCVVSELRARLFERLQRLSLAFHGRHRTGDLVVRLTGDIAVLRDVLLPAVLEGAAHLAVLVGMVALMVAMDPLLAAVAGLMAPILFLSSIRFGARIRAVAREQRKKEGRLAALLGETLSAITVIQAYGGVAALSARFSRQNDRGARAGLSALRIEERTARLVETTLALGSAAVLGIGGYKALHGGPSPGELVVFVSYLRGINKPVQALARLVGKFGKAAACGERIVELLDAPEEIVDSPDAIDAPPLSGEIVFQNVTFGYDAGRPVLRDVSFRIAPGERVAVVGPSGAGKSTLLALLLRLYDPQGGRILVDGIDIRRLKLESYRRQVGVVLQEPFLFGMSVAANIRLGRPDATDVDVEAAARAAGAADFVAALPHGYDTALDERGTSLSRGQQQRIAIARAVVRDAPLLALDEPSTGLDGRTEAAVTQTLAQIADRRTCLWIAHDLPQVLGCSRALLVDGGQILEDGVPDVLIATSPRLRALFSTAAS